VVYTYSLYRRQDIQKCAKLASSATQKVALESYIDEAYHETIIEKCVSVLDLLECFPSIQLPFSEYLNMLQPMRPRHYSISSSPLQDPSVCTVTYGVIDTEALSGQGRFIGVAGSYLKGLTEGDEIQVSVRSTNKFFHLPTDSETPVVMFCAGTGLAPFRGFIQQRAIQLAASKALLAPALLFIGCRSKTKDRLYAEEMDAWAHEGAVDVRYAFSREADKSEGCKYVQDRLLKDRKDLVDLWQRGAKVFVCGAPGLSHAVGETSRKLMQEEARKKGKEMTDEMVEEWFKERRNERFATDVFQ
jgi:cytochrome P450/NADPH-cytochrome P450 reductase